MIVENANVTMQFDLNGLNGSNSLVARSVTLQFATAPNSFLPILVFNDLLRALEPGSMNLVSAAGVNSPGYKALPAELTASLKRLALNKRTWCFIARWFMGRNNFYRRCDATYPNRP
jgi:hypothetical protein